MHRIRRLDPRAASASVLFPRPTCARAPSPQLHSPSITSHPYSPLATSHLYRLVGSFIFFSNIDSTLTSHSFSTDMTAWLGTRFCSGGGCIIGNVSSFGHCLWCPRYQCLVILYKYLSALCGSVGIGTSPNATITCVLHLLRNCRIEGLERRLPPVVPQPDSALFTAFVLVFSLDKRI